MSWRRLLALAAILMATYVWLGVLVSFKPPGPVDRAFLGLRGESIGLAIFLTRAGTVPVYATVCVALIVFGLVRRDWLIRVFLSIVTLVAAWQTSDFCKLLFARPRMPGWIAIHETSYSYASGHTTLSAAFYGLWACYIAASARPGPARTVAVALIVALLLGIGWARMALGAHYLSDVVGGYLLGGTFACLGFAAWTAYSARRAALAAR